MEFWLVLTATFIGGLAALLSHDFLHSEFAYRTYKAIRAFAIDVCWQSSSMIWVSIRSSVKFSIFPRSRVELLRSAILGLLLAVWAIDFRTAFISEEINHWEALGLVTFSYVLVLLTSHPPKRRASTISSAQRR